jgi:hypothetical protein
MYQEALLSMIQLVQRSTRQHTWKSREEEYEIRNIIRNDEVVKQHVVHASRPLVDDSRLMAYSA